MIQKVIIGLASLIVLAALAGGGWWVAADKGWIAGRPNSPRPENFKRGLDDYLKRSATAYNRPCAPMNVPRTPDGMGVKDVRWDWTPASFRAVVDPRRPGYDQPERRFAYLARQGFFTAKSLPDGATEYFLTWKGMGASSGQHCFAMATNERAAEVLSHTLKRTENGVDVYEVIARANYTGLEPWAKTQEFLDVFGKQNFQRYLEPQPVAYELARGETGFEVIAEQGKPLQARMGTVHPALLAKLAGGLTNERVLGAVNTWATGPGAAQMRVCLRPPEPHEADESTLQNMRFPRAPNAEPVTYTIYNLLMRPPHAANPLRGYLALKRFESLGYAVSDTLPAASWRDQPAAGAVKFTLRESFLERYAPDRERCFPVGTLQVAEVVRFDAIGDSSLMQQFLARATIKPWDDEAKKVIDAFPHFQRAQEAGVAVRGTLQYHDGELRVTSAQAQMPAYHPDTAEAKLPVVEPPPPPAPVKGKPAAVPAPPARMAPPQAPMYRLPSSTPAPMLVPAPAPAPQFRIEAAPAPAPQRNVAPAR